MEWTRDKTLALINEYRGRRGLWDLTHEDYRKKELKQKLMLEVSSALGGNIPIVEIEKKFHTLRTQYHREINRMKRKEPYNSKWFGFKNLQFLSSPKACRTSKGRIKSEITEEGTVTKYIVRESVAQLDSSGGSVNSTSNINEEFLTIHRKPMTYEISAGHNAAAAAAAASVSRTHELEKLIEETTKDVDEVEDAKPKMIIKEITVPQEHHSYHNDAGQTHSHSNSNGDGAGGELSAGEQEHQHHHQQQHIDDDGEGQQLDTIDIHDGENEIAYQAASNVVTVQHHRGELPPRIIKVPRRDTCHDDEYYDASGSVEQTQQHQTQSHHHHMHTMPTTTAKRIYYDANGHQHTATILTASPPSHQPTSHSSLLAPLFKMQPQQQAQLHHQPLRDEFATYGEYVANEIRGITNREILVALKHKINTALFEASMAELQK